MDANPGRKVKDAHAEWMQSAERSAFMAGRMGKQLWCNFGVKIHHPVVIPTGFTFETQTRWGMRMWGEHLLKKVLGFSVPTQWISSTSKPDSKYKSPRNSFWNHHDPTEVFLVSNTRCATNSMSKLSHWVELLEPLKYEKLCLSCCLGPISQYLLEHF